MNYHKLPVVPEYPFKLYIFVRTSKSLYTYVLFVSVTQSVNGADFLNITCLLFLSACIAASVAPCPIGLMVSLTSKYASL